MCWAFAGFWTCLLREAGASNDPHTSTTSDKDVGRVGRVVYDNLIGEALGIVHRLDLSYADPDMDSERAKKVKTPEAMPTPANAFDQQLLLNLVDLLCAVLPKAAPCLFVSWADSYFRGIIQLSTVRPYVSGLYKLVTLGLNISKAVARNIVMVRDIIIIINAFRSVGYNKICPRPIAMCRSRRRLPSYSQFM